MTNEELLAKIKAEIERRINELGISDESILLEAELSEILSFLSTLESEKSEVDLEKEIEISIRCLNGLHTFEDNKSWYKGRYEELKEFARHFAKWGAEHASGSSEIPKDLEEAAWKYEGEHSFHPCDYDVTPYDCFIAGAEWQKQHDAELIEIAYNDGITIGMTKQKEQMLKETVDAEVIVPIYEGKYEGNDVWSAEVKMPGRYEVGDKVRVIILPKED